MSLQWFKLSRFLPALAFLMVFSLDSGAQESKKPVSFINDVAPILKQNCFGCHNAKKKSGKFDMTTYENFRAGGRNDDPVVPGNAKVSYLMDVLVATDNSRMPPKENGSPLPKEQIDTIAAWINQGAKLDVGINPDGDLLKELRIRWQPPALLSKYQYPALINSMVFTPDNKHLVTSGHHELLVWNAESGKLEKRVHTRAERAYDMEFLANGQLIVAGGRPGQEGDVRVYDLNGKAKNENGVAILDGVNDSSVLISELLQTNDEMRTLDVSDDGKRLAAAGCDRLIRIWDIGGGITNPKLLDTIENHADWVLCVSFSPDGTHLLTASRDKSAKVWDLKTKESFATFQDHKEAVWGVTMSADGRFGISVGEDRNIRTWQADSKTKQPGKQVKTSGGHSKLIVGLAEYRKGKEQILATCSADGTVRIWDPVRLQVKKTLSGFDDWVYAVAFSHDGKRIAAGDYDGVVRIWDADSGKELLVFNASPGYQPKTARAKSK